MTDSKKLGISRRGALELGAGAAALFAASAAVANVVQQKTPGVYITEEDAFPNSVVEVPTSVVAFVGYSEKASYNGRDLRGKPVKVTSMAEFETIFGGPPSPLFGLIERPAPLTAESLADAAGADSTAMRMPFDVSGRTDGPFDLSRIDTPYLLHNAMTLFFQNGGGDCYVTSVGSYEDQIDADALGAALTTLEKEPEPALLVIPEAVRLSRPDAAALQQEMLRHCGETMRSRVAILDVHGGYLPLDHPAGSPVSAFRDEIGLVGLDFGAAYYPWLQTELHSVKEFTFANMPEYTRGVVAEAIRAEHGEGSEADKVAQRILPNAPGARAPHLSPEDIDSALRAASPLYVSLTKAMAKIANRQPPSAMMAGAYASQDNEIGVWKAPANIGLSGVLSPMAPISHDQQEDLNVPISGLAVNAIRSFVGRGVLVWGARTLDGNSQDWRYINVRRTMIMLEQSIKEAAQAFVFAANDSTTWATVKSMIENFLTNVWKAGGLAGATPSDAFSVDVGLGSTMTAVDVLEGIMRISVKVAVAHPAEFIEITFEQQMQKS